MARRVLDEHGDERKRKVFALNEYMEHRYLEIEEFYFDRKRSEWTKKKGISINQDTYRVLRDVLDRRDAEIMDWIGVGYVPEEVSRYEEVQAAAAHDSKYQIGELVVAEHSEPRDPCFFTIQHEGGQTRVSFNTAHPLSATLIAQGPETVGVVASLLAAYHRARLMLGDTPAFDPASLFDHLEQDWGKYLRDSLRGR